VCVTFEGLTPERASKHDEVGHVFADFDGFVEHIVAPLLFARDGAQAKLNDKGILIRLFLQAVAKLIKHLKGAAYDGFGLGLENESVSIRVHPWFKLFRFHGGV
jgi:hypothetical protein